MTPTPLPRMPKTPLVPILRGIRPEEVLGHAEALLDAGFDSLEVPLNSPGWEESIRLLATTLKGRALIGAGTVLRTQEVARLAQVGCQLVVTPNTDAAVIAAARQAGMLTCIGCLTPTEAQAALQAGAEVLKIFPASLLGPRYIKALRAVLPRQQAVWAVGGVSTDTLAEYLGAGYSGAGIGDDLYAAGQSIEHTRLRARAYMQAWRQLTPSLAAA